MAKGVEAFARARRRIGGASALFSVGCTPEHIKALGRWWSGAYLLYIRKLQGQARKVMVKACSERAEYSTYLTPRTTNTRTTWLSVARRALSR